LKQPVEDHPAFDAALTVQDEDYLGEVGVVESLLYDSIAVADVLGCVIEVSLDEALEDVEEDAVSVKELSQRSRGIGRPRRGDLRFIVYAKDRAPECEGEAIDVAL
jgi:hypothetical protein